MDEIATTATEPDRYDEAIDYLVEYPDGIEAAWGQMDVTEEDDDGNEYETENPAACLFAVTGFVRCHDGSLNTCGCLTQVVDRTFRAPTNELTDAIRADLRIPRDPEDISPEDLEVFAEWQRKLDAMLPPFVGDEPGSIGRCLK